MHRRAHIRLIKMAAATSALVLLTGCSSELRESSSASPSGEPASTSTAAVAATTTPTRATTASPSPENLTRAEACEQIAGGTDSLAHRVTNWTSAVDEAGAIQPEHYSTALTLSADLEALGEIAPVAVQEHIDALHVGPNAMVEAIKDGDGAIQFAPNDSWQAALFAANDCLPENEREAFGEYYYEAVMGEPLSDD